MTLPANDAFTLGLPHDPSRPSYHLRSRLRSSSPRLPFASAKSSHAPVNPAKSPAARRRPSMQVAETQEPSHANSDSEPTPTEITKASTQEHKESTKDRALKPPIDWEIPRKTLHTSIGFVTLYLYATHTLPRDIVLVLGMALAIIVPADILRLRSHAFERFYERCLGFLMRESEKKHTNGVIWYIVGVIFVLSIYPKDIAVVSILILSWADTAASTFGRAFGSFTPKLPSRLPILRLPLAPRKSVAGFIAGSVTGACIAVGFWNWFVTFGDTESSWAWSGETSDLSHWVGVGILGVVSGLVSGVAEALDLGSLDDNLTLPIISGGCLWGFFKLVNYFFS